MSELREWRATCPLLTIARAMTVQGCNADPKDLCDENCAFYNPSQKICTISGQKTVKMVQTVDAVEVVRCRDCVHFGECLVTENDYCSKAERKEIN